VRFCQQLSDLFDARHWQAVSGPAAWQLFLEATQDPAAKPNGGKAGDSMDTAGIVTIEAAVLSNPPSGSTNTSTRLCCPAGTQWPLQPTKVSLPPKHKALLTLLPPCQNVADPLIIVDIARTAEVPIHL
jgi:hypothetical protein